MKRENKKRLVGETRQGKRLNYFSSVGEEGAKVGEMVVDPLPAPPLGLAVTLARGQRFLLRRRRASARR